METKDIPRTFWHALSFCMIAATLGLLFIAYKSSSISIEIANAKINLSSAIAQTKEIKSTLKLENERLIAANKEMEKTLTLLAAPAIGSSRTEGKCGEGKCGGGASGGFQSSIPIDELKKHGLLGGSNSELRRIEIPKEWFMRLDEKIQSAERALTD